MFGYKKIEFDNLPLEKQFAENIKSQKLLFQWLIIFISINGIFILVNVTKTIILILK